MIRGSYLDMDNGFSLNAYAKINLVLDVTGIRDDGYHMVRMIMQTIGIHDTLTFRKGRGSGIRLTMNADDLPAGHDNLIIKGIEAVLRSSGRKIKTDDISLDIDLEKRIPIAAGMAGGSTDAAAAMYAVNKIEDIGLTNAQLRAAAVSVGADVPYCLMGGTVLAEGIGEILTPLHDIEGICIAVAKPAESVSTKHVYEMLDSTMDISHPDVDGALGIIGDCAWTKQKAAGKDAVYDRGGTGAIDIGEKSAEALAQYMGNVLEYVTIPEHKDIADIKNVMESCGAVKALMSGSGPSVFGIFKGKDDAETACDEIRSRGLADSTFVTETIGRGKGETIYA